MSASCVLCESREVELVFRSSLPFSVRSDWIPVAAPTEIWGCKACGHVFKPDSITRANADYVNYVVMDNDPSIDKLEFSTAHPTSRSESIIAYLRQRGFYREGSRILDYGCNRGAFLARLPPGKHAGFEVSPHYRPVVEGLGFDFFHPDKLPCRQTYDGATLIHVLEHLQDIRGMLQPALSATKDSAFFLIQVPDLKNQLSDAYVIDHCSHFFESTLESALLKAGLHLVGSVESIIPGELTGIFVRSKTQERGSAPKTAWSEVHLEIKKRLEETEKRIKAVAAGPDGVAIYGAGLLGSLLSHLLGTKIRTFIDDSPQYQGKQLLGYPIVSLEQLEVCDEPVVIAVPPMATERVYRKCLEKGLRPAKIFSSEEWTL